MFEFDHVKSEANRAKHGIDFEQAQRLWLDGRLIILPGRDGQPTELRWLAIGRINALCWTAIFTWRDDRIWLISVRRARREEVAFYERQDD